jgi:mRNA interferase MazF
MQPSKGDVVLLNFPFSDLSGKKMRPALVLAVRRTEVTVAFISSQVDKMEADDLAFPAATHTGLTRPSLVRVAKLATLDRQQIQYGMGQLSADELARVDAAMRRVYQL